MTCIGIQMTSSCGSLLFLVLPIISAQYKDGDIRLIEGSYPWQGRVEIYFSQIWGTITDSEWTSNDAQVVCRKLGYFKPGATGQTGAYFGSGSGPIHLDYVVCSGTEYNLTDCQTGNETRQSSHSEDVGVKCQTIDSSYREGDIRLVGGDYNWEGRVEIFYSGTWSTISDTSWISSDATVVCRQLQHSTEGADPRCCGFYGAGSGPVLFRSLSCSGSEETITSCYHYSTSIDYDHQYDVGVKCQRGNIYHEGDIRLVGGSYSWEGRVEIYLNGEWGTILNRGGDRRVTHVVCQQLGYDTRNGYTDTSYCCARFGQGSGPIHIIYPSCSGTEHKLTDCHNSRSLHNYHRDWSVTCDNDGPSAGEVRLYHDYYAPSYYYGHVEVYSGEEWGIVADDSSWTIEDGEVVCQQLGYDTPHVETDLDISYYTSYRETAPILMSDVQCSGNESRLIECPHSSGGSGSGVALNCHKSERCYTGELRLVGGETEREGRVEVCSSYSSWGTVCNKQWTPSHTRVVCRSLGYSDSVGSYQAPHTFGGSVIPILMDYVNCYGSEVRLWDCVHFTHSYGCSHSDDAGVHCQQVHCEDGDIKSLVEETSGRVEMCINKRWATVHYDEYISFYGYARSDYDSPAATVACRQLGYASGIRRYFQRVTRSLQVSLHSCSGTEFRLSDCGYTVNEYYSPLDTMGVMCDLADCVDGEVRLMDGKFELEGRLEVCFDQRWGTVGSDGWTQTNTKIVCNDLGYDTEPDNDYSLPRTSTNSMPVYINTLHCSGEELNLLHCSYTSNPTNNDHTKDLGVQCKNTSCDDGDLRLFGGESESEGLLEVCFSQRWGTVNGDGWTSSDTQVACRQLGFEGAGDLSSFERRGILSAPIFMDNIACYGSEDKLTDCNYRTDTMEDDHINDIWINCDVIGSSTNKQSTVALAVSLVGLGISVLVIGFLIFLIGYILCRHKNRACTGSHSVQHKNDVGGNDEVITMENNSRRDTIDSSVRYQFHDKGEASVETQGKTTRYSDHRQSGGNGGASIVTKEEIVCKSSNLKAVCKPGKTSHYQPLTVRTMEKDRPYRNFEVMECRDGIKRGGLRPTEVNLALDEQLYDLPTK